MALPPDLTTIVITDTYSDLSGKPLGGSVTFTPTSQLADVTGNVVFVHQTVTATVSPATGTFSVTLPCTDNALEPVGWAYVVQIGVPGIDGTAFTALFPSTLGASVHLRTVAPAVPPPPPLGTAVYSVNGQSGAVSLGAAQTGAVPLAGGAMTGPLILSADPSLPLGAATKQYVDSHEGGGGGGGGTVTGVSVVGTNGFAGTVTNPATNPAITVETTVTGLLIGNGTAVSAAVAGTDYDAPGAAAAAQSNAESFATSAVASETTRATAAEVLKLPLAGGTVSGPLTVSGQLTVAGGLQIPHLAANGDVLTSDGAGNAGWAAVTGGGSGSVTTVSVASANGFAGTVANSTSTPALTLETTVTGLLKGNGTGVSAAVSGTDYDAAGAATSAVATETTRATTAEALALPKAGGTLTGPLILAADPSAALGAATKQYVDSHGGASTSTIFNVKSAAYGAKGDGQYVATGAITSGQATLTIGGSAATFAAGDVGKNIIIYGAGASGAHLGNATISTFTDSTHVTISTSAGTTVSNAIVVWGTNDTTAVQAAVTAGGPGGSIYFPPGIYVMKGGLGNNLNGCRIYGDGAGSVQDGQQAFSSGSGTFYGSCIVMDTSNSASLVPSTSTASFREFDHLAVVWTAPGGKIFASEGTVNTPAYIHDCRFEVNDPGGSGQVIASFVVDPFGEWARCGFIQTSSTRQLPLYQCANSSSGQEANLSFNQCQFLNYGTDSSQYLVDIEFQGASSGGDGYAMQIAFRDCTFGRPWGGAVKMLGVINPVIDNCALWDLADTGHPSVTSASNPGILYFGEYSASSPCRGVKISSCFKNRSWADGSHVWDVYCESTTQSVLIEQFSTKPDSNSAGANFYANFNGCGDVTMIGCQAPTGNNPGATVVSNAGTGVTVLNGAVTLSTPLALTSGGTGSSSLTAYAPVTGGTSPTGALQAVSNSGATTGQVLTYQGASSMPTWTTATGGGGSPTLPDGTGGLWELAVDVTGALYTQPVLQDEVYGVITDEAGNALV